MLHGVWNWTANGAVKLTTLWTRPLQLLQIAGVKYYIVTCQIPWTMLTTCQESKAGGRKWIQVATVSFIVAVLHHCTIPCSEMGWARMSFFYFALLSDLNLSDLVLHKLLLFYLVLLMRVLLVTYNCSRLFSFICILIILL